jgi:hypothetical protein
LIYAKRNNRNDGHTGNARNASDAGHTGNASDTGNAGMDRAGFASGFLRIIFPGGSVGGGGLATFLGLRRQPFRFNVGTL